MASHTKAVLASTLVALVRITPVAVNFKGTRRPMMLRDVNHGGRGIVSGTVKDKGSPDTPVARRVRLHRKIDGMLVREMWSAADGSYAFMGLAIQLYYVVSHDHTGNFNAVIKDSIMPEVA